MHAVRDLHLRSAPLLDQKSLAFGFSRRTGARAIRTLRRDPLRRSVPQPIRRSTRQRPAESPSSFDECVPPTSPAGPLAFSTTRWVPSAAAIPCIRASRSALCHWPIGRAWRPVPRPIQALETMVPGNCGGRCYPPPAPPLLWRRSSRRQIASRVGCMTPANLKGGHHQWPYYMAMAGGVGTQETPGHTRLAGAFDRRPRRDHRSPNAHAALVCGTPTQRRYCSSLTCSSHSTALPSSCS